MTSQRGRSGNGPASRPKVVAILGLAAIVTLGACSLGPAPTPYPTPVPTPAATAATVAAQKYLAAWKAGNFDAMWDLLAPLDRARFSLERFTSLHRQFATLVGVTSLETTSGDPQPAVLPPQLPPAAPATTASPAASDTTTPSASASSTAATSSGAPLGLDASVTAGPVQAMAVPVNLTFATDLLGDVTLPRSLLLGQGTSGWQVRWSPELLFPELGDDGTLALTRQTSPRGRIVSRNGTVFAMTRPDGMRVYPQESLAGQAIGYVSKVTADDLKTLAAFDPNAMTLGTTLRGFPLARANQEQITDKAVLGAYPAGSSFKPFTLGAALQIRTVTTATRMLCPGTWTYSGFTFKNWMEESLGGYRPWVDTMALSCNTTYMPLSILVYQRTKTALTDLQSSFGFGSPTGIEFLAESPGILPDAAYFETHERWNGKISPYGPFDQIQLAIGQGSFLGTPLQLALAYAAWGNRGTLWKPRTVLKATLPDGRVVSQSKPTA